MSELVNLRVSETWKTRRELAAERLDISLSELLRRGAEIYGALHPGTVKILSDFSDGMGIPQGIVLENILLSWLAQREAFAQVFGAPPEGGVLYEFQVSKDGFKHGPALLEELIQHFVGEFESHKESELTMMQQFGFPVNEEDIAWLEERRERRSRLQEQLATRDPKVIKGLAHHRKMAAAKGGAHWEGEELKGREPK